MPRTREKLECRTDKTTAHMKQTQSGGVRRVPEHQSVDSAEMGTRPEKAQWSVIEVVESRSAKRLGGARLRRSPEMSDFLFHAAARM